MSIFHDNARAKFERGALEHHQPWNANSIDAVGEMKGELYDLYNYADLLEDKNKKMKIRIYAEVMWELLND